MVDQRAPKRERYAAYYFPAHTYRLTSRTNIYTTGLAVIARDTFRLARERGWTRFYDLPIAYWETSQRLLREEAERQLREIDIAEKKLARRRDGIDEIVSRWESNDEPSRE